MPFFSMNQRKRVAAIRLLPSLNELNTSQTVDAITYAYYNIKLSCAVSRLVEDNSASSILFNNNVPSHKFILTSSQ